MIRDPRDIAISYSKHMNKDINETIHFLLDGQIMQKEKNALVIRQDLTWFGRWSSAFTAILKGYAKLEASFK